MNTNLTALLMQVSPFLRGELVQVGATKQVKIIDKSESRSPSVVIASFIILTGGAGAGKYYIISKNNKYK